ncbi:amidohydrolase family protein [Aquincola sp. MAHUQ-54]|uniref:Amidohydrolase family protein n=1 Tax=Aquincola agrisoli TaxID=3119538 RepID=A0AAW9PZD4_9BURK
MSAPKPAGGWDCHAHLFGPYERYPLAPDRSYTPPEAVEAQYLTLLGRLGLDHGVLVHPSAYGEDYRLLFDALAAQPRWRGVIVARPGTLPTLKGLRERGVRAARYSHRSGAGANFAGSASFEDLRSMAPALADAGLHAELWTDCQALPDIAEAIVALPVPVVIDHMGGFDVDAGVNDTGFLTLLSLLETGHVYVKLCVYRNLLKAAGLDAGRPFQAAMLRANPDRLVWGSDWPHLRVEPAPDAAQLLAWMKNGVADEALVRRILVDNPQRLYA